MLFAYPDNSSYSPYRFYTHLIPTFPLRHSSSEQIMTKVVLITGANRGLGYAVLQVAGSREPSTTFILCSRDLESGEKAKSQLEQEGISAAIDVLRLDVTNDDQIMEAIQHVTVKYGKLDGMSREII